MACAAAGATLTHFSKLPFLSIHKPQKTHLFSLHSIDVSKEDPTQTNPPTESPPEEEEEPEFDKRRLEEKFAVLNTGIYECRSCGYKYDEAVGDPSYPIPPGFQFDKLPDEGRFPFESKSVEIAGFAQNQRYGSGGNALTSGQKAFVIYGTLLFFSVLFLSGYSLQ
uniref:Rubredoxin-like domain-containing protein n=1 Tax=Salix viminalis TaxID=40686 RepID=A0A6N2LW11_SALVM